MSRLEKVEGRIRSSSFAQIQEEQQLTRRGESERIIEDPRIDLQSQDKTMESEGTQTDLPLAGETI